MLQSTPRRRRLLLSALAAMPGLAAIAAAAVGMPSGFIHHGHFQRMMHSGDTSGKVLLSALPQRPGAWGLGATAGLRGEIIQIDGRLLVSPGTSPQGQVRPPQPGEQATLFGGAHVPAWREVPVPQDLDSAAFEAFVLDQARAAGLAPDQPFVFRVEGRFPHLRWHVVTGEKAPGGGHGGHGKDHANEQSGLRVFRQPGASGQVVGVYSGPALEGAMTHPGERFHLHFADAGATVSGHVDFYSVGAGAVLKLPVN